MHSNLKWQRPGNPVAAPLLFPSLPSYNTAGGAALGCHSDAAPTRRVDHSASVAAPAAWGMLAEICLAG
jgi:hypothetical protein